MKKLKAKLFGKLKQHQWLELHGHIKLGDFHPNFGSDCQMYSSIKGSVGKI